MVCHFTLQVSRGSTICYASTVKSEFGGLQRGIRTLPRLSCQTNVRKSSPFKAALSKIDFDQSGNTLSQQSVCTAAATISGQPIALYAAVTGEPASFSVNVASTLPVTYQWYFNGILISGATGDTLLLNNPALANEGLYTVTNSLGSVTSNPSRLAIDSNGNGLGENWEQQYFGNLDQKATGGFDGDPLAASIIVQTLPPGTAHGVQA